MIAEGQVGIQLLNDGANQTLRMTKLAALVIAQLHGRYYEQSYRGFTFCGSLQAAGAVTLTSVTTTVTGLVLINPPGSGKNLILLDICIALATAPAAASTFVLAANVNPILTAPTASTAVPIRPTLLGSGAASVAGLYSSVTWGAIAQVPVRAIGGGPVGASSTTSPFIRDEVAGGIILAPGTSVNLGTITTTMNVLASMTWEEVTI